MLKAFCDIRHKHIDEFFRKSIVLFIMSFRGPDSYPVRKITVEELLTDGLLISESGTSAIQIECGLENWRNSSGGSVTGELTEAPGRNSVHFYDLVGTLLRGELVRDEGDGFVEFVVDKSRPGLDVRIDGEYPADAVNITYQ